MRFGSSDDWLGHLRKRLLAPQCSVTAFDLAQQFRVETVSVTVLRPPDFEIYPDLSVRVRGALGNTLHAMAPPRPLRVGGPQMPSAWDVLMEPVLKDVAKPMVVHVDVLPTTITAHIHLIGHATFWRPDVQAALIAAFDQGIKLSNNGPLKTILEIVGVDEKCVPGFDPPPTAITEARFMFESPLRLRSEGSTLVSIASFVISLCNRVKSLATWMDFALDEDWKALHAAAWALQGSSEDLVPIRWDRGSKRAKGKIPVLGFMGTLVITGQLDRLIPYFQICEMMNTGSHAALGLGRYRLMVLP